MLVVTYLGDLFRTSMVQGGTAEQYVSAVNRAYDLLGLQAPGRMPISSEPAFEVQTTIRGFTNGA
jgi:hypothetical protein